MLKIKIPITILLLSFIGFQGFSQITVLENHKSDTTKYQSETAGKDSIFVFYIPNENGIRIDPTLQARFGNETGLTFEWFKYNNAIQDFAPIASTDFDDYSNVEDAQSGGYKVEITNGIDIDTSFISWLNIQQFELREIELIESACDFIEFKADVDFETDFIYYDPIDKVELLFQNEIDTYLWTANDSNLNEPYSSITVEPPYEETRYWLEISDRLGFVRKTFFDIDEESRDDDGNLLLIAVKADFKGIGHKDTELQDTVVNIEAPRGVMFFNESKNGEEYEWKFYNHPDWIKIHSDDTLINSSNLFEPFDSIFYKDLPPHYLGQELEYDVKLTVTGPEYYLNGEKNNCVDSLRKEGFVLVDTTSFPASLAELPNVFSPNGDGQNDEFHYLKEGGEKELPNSIKSFSIKIYNRWGNKVYQYEDDNGDWHENGKDGWDGTTRFGGKAKPGIYYYTIFATGWDNSSKKVEGYVHIFY